MLTRTRTVIDACYPSKFDSLTRYEQVATV